MTSKDARPESLAESVTSAFQKAVEVFGLSHEQLAKIIGAESLYVVDLHKQARTLDLSSNVGTKASVLVRVFLILRSMIGSDEENMRHWIETENIHLGGRPKDVMQQDDGLELVCEYLQAMRLKG